MVIHGKTLEDAFDQGLKNIHIFEPGFSVDKKVFLDEFRRLRKQI